MLNKNSVLNRIRISKGRFLIFLFLSKVLLILANIRLFAENLYSFGNRVDVFHNLLQMLQDPWNWTNTWPRVENFYCLTSTLSGFAILNAVILMIQNWLPSKTSQTKKS